MQTATHTGFIIAAYAAAAVVVVGLTAWVMLDYRAQLRALAGLEKRGITRRPAPPPQPATEQAKEEA
jgi:heme exporter protein D